MKASSFSNSASHSARFAHDGFARRAAGRHGVLLLVMLIMLIMFALISIMFVVTATRARLTAKTHARIDAELDPYPHLLDGAFLQLVRGSTNKYSALQYHSLLHNMYGGTPLKGATTLPKDESSVFLKGKLTVAASYYPNSNNQIISLTGQLLTAADSPLETPPDPQLLSLLPGYYNGCVLTMLSGNGLAGQDAAGCSVRIIGYKPPTTVAANQTFTLLVLPFDVDGSAAVLPATGAIFLINNRAYSGGGNGIDAVTGGMTVAYTIPGTTTTIPLANVLNHRMVDFSQKAAPSTPTRTDRLADAMAGAMDYNAPDVNNPHLAYLDISAGLPTAATGIIPSFHRKELFPAANTISSTNVNQIRMWSMRPLGPITGAQASYTPDHPKFTGSNPSYTPGAGPWDVDNLGTGVPDSIWTDLGYPAVTGRNGRMVKPLFAILCLDLDGKLNINAHGNWSHMDMASATLPSSISLGASTTYANLPKGYGFGPAELVLGPNDLKNPPNTGTAVFPNTLFNTTQLTALFGKHSGPTAGAFDGRYGEAATTATNPNRALPGLSGTQGAASYDKLFNVPDKYTATVVSAYGSVPDLRGMTAIAVDAQGQPVRWPEWSAATNGNAIARKNNPYESNLNSTTNFGLPSPSSMVTTDNFYTAAEYERLLRPADVDSSTLPTRLLSNLALSGDTRLGALTITPYSFDAPSPSFIRPKELRQLIPVGATNTGISKQLSDPRGNSILDLAAARLKKSGMTDANLLPKMLQVMLAPELVAGVRMNVNRPFGNGKQTSGGVVADQANKAAPASDKLPYNGANDQINFNYTNDDQVITDNTQARQIMARHLYCLMMLLHDTDYDSTFPLTDGTLTPKDAFAQRCAQWAINVVSFRESNSAMPPFEYDKDPWGQSAGWRVDGKIGQSSPDDGQSFRGLVWGCKPPDLLLTETLAFHDRRVGDTPTGTGTKKGRADPSPNTDPDLDQIRIPQGSLFLEFYCPRSLQSANNHVLPPDLYTSNQLDLGKMAPAGGTSPTSPVWRAVITVPTANYPTGRATADFLTQSASNPYSFNFAVASADIERVVWFSQTKPAATDLAVNKTYYNHHTTQPLLTPGHYAVVAPRMTTTIGRTIASPAGPSGQRIDLKNSLTAPVLGGDSTSSPTGAVENILPIIAAGDVSGNYPTTWNPTNKSKTLNLGLGTATAQLGVGISVSEPLFTGSYYPEPLFTNTSPDPNASSMDTYGTLAQATPLDRPLEKVDGSTPNVPLSQTSTTGTGTHLNFKTVVLQRLANPLMAYNPEQGQPGHSTAIPVNPYITVDWMPVDLTTFNGEKTNASATGADTLPWDPEDKTPGTPRFASRHRGPAEPYAASPAHYNIWSQTSFQENATQNNSDVFKHKLKCSLGFVNPTYSTTPTTKNVSGTSVKGEPQVPFPWIAFHARPYANAMELLDVPSSSPSRMLWEFNFPNSKFPDPNTGATPNTNPYSQITKASPPTYQHLMYLFSDDTSVGATTPKAPAAYRVLDYVEVPSPFTGTDLVVSPNTFTGSVIRNTGSPTDIVAYNANPMHPPFNTVSKYRDPGKINLNTIASPQVFAGLVAADPYLTANLTFDNFKKARGGGTATKFDAPFRSPMAADLTTGAARLGVDCTLLRPATTGGTTPLFATQTHNTASTDDYRNTDRNSFLHYQSLMRLGNLTTTRSNVYAVWVTMGYFEVAPVAVDAAHPDGYQLGAEVGADDGSIERHRAFYIYDRSIPVGYERGFNHNVHRGIVTRRIIE